MSVADIQQAPAVASAASPPIRVLLIAPSLDIVGGQAVQAARLITELSKEPEVAIAFQPINPRLPRWIRGIRYVRTFMAFLTYCVLLLWRIPRYDIVHVFSAGLSSFTLWTVPAVYISRLYGKKCIINYRDGRAEQHLKSSRLAKPTLLRADMVVTPSQYLVEIFGAYGIPARRIYNIIDLSKFRYRPRPTLRPRFMTNRRLERLYNIGCILRAFALIQREIPDATLTIAHDGPLRAELEAAASNMGLRNVEFIGEVPPERVASLYDECDIYLTTPNIDCMPGSLLECFASGVIVIATAVGGIPYIVTNGKTGWLVPINDHAALAECALRVLAEPDNTERMTRIAFKELERYGWATIRNEWIQTYRELVGSEHPLVTNRG